MTDIYPALVAIYPSETINQPNFDPLLVGFADKSAKIYNDCRVIVHNFHLFVGIDSPRGPQTAFHDTYSAENVLKTGTVHRVITDSGFLVVVGNSKGCGCGSRLRSWNPYGNIQRSNRD